MSVANILNLHRV